MLSVFLVLVCGRLIQVTVALALTCTNMPRCCRRSSSRCSETQPMLKGPRWPGYLDESEDEQPAKPKTVWIQYNPGTETKVRETAPINV